MSARARARVSALGWMTGAGESARRTSRAACPDRRQALRSLSGALRCRLVASARACTAGICTAGAAPTAAPPLAVAVSCARPVGVAPTPIGRPRTVAPAPRDLRAGGQPRARWAKALAEARARLRRVTIKRGRPAPNPETAGARLTRLPPARAAFYRYHSWEQNGKEVDGAQDATEASQQVQEEEASLSPQQQQEFQQLQAQQKGRHLLQGAKTQSDIKTIGNLNAVDGAKPYPCVPA